MAQAIKFVVDAGWKIIFKDLGLSINEVLKRAQLPCDLFACKDATLTTEEYFRLWKGMEDSLDDPLFPLRAGQMVSAEAFSPPIFAVLCSPNLNVGMKRLSHYKKLIGPMKLDVEQKNKVTTISLDCLYRENPIPNSLVAVELVFLIHLVRLATRQKIVPLAIHSTTALTNHDGYEEYFGVRPKQAKTNQLKFSEESATTPFITENEGMWQFFEPELRRRLADIDVEATFACRVSSSLYELLPSGLCSIDDVAKRLAVSKRTLQRRLSSENTSFQAELTKTREKLARHYLVSTTLPNSQIAFLLGFDDPNSFVRAFRIWTKKTPQSIRKKVEIEDNI